MFTRIASLEIEMGKLDQASQRLTEGLQKDPDNSGAHLLLAQTNTLMDKQEAALHEYEETLRLDPQNMHARVAYIELLNKLGRTSMELAAHTRLYELSPADESIHNRQKELIDASMADLFGETHEWQNDWHLGDFTEIGGLSRAVCAELDLTPHRSELPKQFNPVVDETIVSLLVARLPTPGSEEDGVISAADEIDAADDESVAETIEKTEGPAPESEIEIEVEAEADSSSVEDEAAELDPDADLQADAETEVSHEIPADDDMQDEVESVDIEFSEEQSEEPEIENAVEESASAEEEDESTTDDPIDEPEIEEAVEESTSAEEENESTTDDPIDEPEPLSELKQALITAGQPIDDIIDYETTLKNFKSETPVLVEKPDLEDLDVQDITDPEQQLTGATDQLQDETDAQSSSVEGERIDSSSNKRPESKIGSSSGILDQQDLDKLLGSFKEGSLAPGTKHLESPSEQDSGAEKTQEPELSEEETSESIGESDLDQIVSSFQTKIEETRAQSEATPELAEPAHSDVEEEDSPQSMSQSDLDNLMTKFKSANQEPAPEISTTNGGSQETSVQTDDNSESESDDDAHSSGAMSQTDLDALMASFKPDTTSISTSPSDKPEEEQSALEDVQDVDEAVEESPSESQADMPEKTDPTTQDEIVEKSSAQKPSSDHPRNLGEQVVSKPAEIEDIDELADQYAAKRRAKPGSQAPVEIGLHSEPEVEESDDGSASDSTPQQPESQELDPDSNLADSADQIEDPDPGSATSPEKETTEEIETVQEFVPYGGQATGSIEPEIPADPVSASPEPVTSAKPVEPAIAQADPVPTAPQKAPPRAQDPPMAAPLPRPARKRPIPPAPLKRDEAPPEEYRGPVSKTLIKLQLGQGKVDHARVMFARLQQQNPTDPDLESLASQIENAAQ